MDAERFYGTLRDAVNAVRAAEVALGGTKPDSAANYRAIIDRRRNRDTLTSLISQQPEEFAGLVVALAAQVHEQGEVLRQIRNDVAYLITGEVQS